MNNKYKTVEELQNQVEKVILDTTAKLVDSPISRNQQICNHIGFAQGYADALNWNLSMDWIRKMSDLA